MTSSWYRRTVWNYKGNREYTRSGYLAASTRFNESHLDVDCTDKHYLITGSNSGIGLATALEIARRGGVIHMVCRNKEAATTARAEIITTTGNDKIHVHTLDLAKPREVIKWSQRFAAQHDTLNVLIHNAGCMLHQRNVDQDGVETNFAVNTLAVHILTLTLMPLLERSEDARVVMVSSAGLLCVQLDPHDLMHENMEPFNGALVYSQNKRQQVVMALWYAQRYNKVHFSSMHPGWADTVAVRTSIPLFYERMKDNLRTAAQGADTVVWLAVSQAARKHPSGLFFQDREPVSTHLPLAWTKTTIEDEDFLMTNIQDLYTKIHAKVFPQSNDPQTDPQAVTAPSASSQVSPSSNDETTGYPSKKTDLETLAQENGKSLRETEIAKDELKGTKVELSAELDKEKKDIELSAELEEEKKDTNTSMQTLPNSATQASTTEMHPQVNQSQEGEMKDLQTGLSSGMEEKKPGQTELSLEMEDKETNLSELQENTANKPHGTEIQMETDPDILQLPLPTDQITSKTEMQETADVHTQPTKEELNSIPGENIGSKTEE